MTWEGKSFICPWLCTLYRPVGRVQAGMHTDLERWPKPAQSFALFVSGLAETDSLRHFSLLPFKTRAQQIKAGQTLSVACQEGQVAKSFSHISRHWEKFRRCLQAAEVFVEIPGCSFQEFTHRTIEHSCRGVRAQAAGWDAGLSNGAQVFLGCVNAGMTARGWLGAEADGRTETLIFVPIIISFVFLQIINKCLKRSLSSSLGCFGGLE